MYVLVLYIALMHNVKVKGPTQSMLRFMMRVVNFTEECQPREYGKMSASC